MTFWIINTQNKIAQLVPKETPAPSDQNSWLVEADSAEQAYEIALDRQAISPDSRKITAYPCGCVYTRNEDGYKHFVHPECKHDNGYRAPIRGYEYRPWSERPQ